MALIRAQRIQAQQHLTAERDVLPDLEAGRFIWNGSTSQLQVYDGTQWQSFYYAGESIDGSLITGSIDGSLITGSIDGALLTNEVDASLLTGNVDAALVDGELDGGRY